ncbi:bacillithiol transferase BstA [Fictibacillus sp. KIGAM418]|uniref:Putative metal-dependent hydrolase LCY76_06845 n=1 Tax=Fictibacillus marinisediminis TaxID=2878389 RepID=A0A9X1X8U1_9BACL|nr:putative metal-dependent hydrolase [Fictibacillus marinisediminis]MCK6256312.1 bacillithiol transferase BstA [Fictibacillus marinisediminis]
MIDLRYPVGLFALDQDITAKKIEEWIHDIESAPNQLKEAVNDLTEEQLDTPYRPGGWTVRQVVHHLPDSHLNSYTRFKLALTEENPVIRPYKEDQWAELPDSILPIAVSIQLLEALHERWIVLLKSLTTADLEKTFTHPDSGVVTLAQNIGLYSWHSRHHIAHITSLRQRSGW